MEMHTLKGLKHKICATTVPDELEKQKLLNYNSCNLVENTT